jgi:hypothetical protein
MNITNFLILNSEGHEIQADAHCNNLAFKCQECDYPVLAATLDNQRGSDEKNLLSVKVVVKHTFLIHVKNQRNYMYFQ